MKSTDTIAAIATPPGRGGVGIVRISGCDLLPLAQALTGKTPGSFKARRAAVADFVAADGQPLDSGLLLYFPAPHSFTGEDVLELHGHGGPVVLHALLARCVELGARLAEPGEFSRRAFENDKIDLAQAEGIADLIDAASQQAARAAVRSLNGEFSRSVRALTDGLIELRSLIEATLDFSDEEIDPIAETDRVARLQCLRTDLAALRTRAREGAALRAGLTVVLAGLPNVGKSSLLNQLAGAERALVTAIPGTTRDAVRETILVEGIPLHIIDTAGLRETVDEVEKLGIERSWKEIASADVVLQLVDARSGLTPADRNVVARLPAGIERVVIENKCDLACLPPERTMQDGVVHLRLSAKTGAGRELLHDELLRIAGWRGHGEDALLARARHLEALAEAEARLAAAADQLAELELAAEELRFAQQALSRITGQFSADDLLGSIFGRFCIGK